MLAPSLPYPPHWAAGIRRYEFLRHLARHHEVSLVAYVGGSRDEPNIRALTELGITLHSVPTASTPKMSRRWAQLLSLFAGSSFERRSNESNAMQNVIDQVMAQSDIDVVIVETCHMSGFHVSPRVTKILDEHNIEYELLFRGFQAEVSPVRRLFNLLESAKVRREERAAWRRADACIVHSNRERDIVRRYAPSKPTFVVTNGVHIEEFDIRADSRDPNAIVFTGAMNYRPNADAVTFFVNQILPRIHESKPDVTFYAVGIGPSDELLCLAGPRVVITGEVPDVKPYLKKASVYVIPVRFGSGTRLKVVEALAAGTPVVSTTVGCEGHDSMKPGVHFLAADDAESFANEVLRVLVDASAAADLSRSGRELVEREYAWPALFDRLDEVIDHATRANGQVESGRILALGSR